VTFYAGGRGFDQIPRDHLIGANEGGILATDGTQTIQSAPASYFEFPIVEPLPEGLNLIR
jgi:hypothetical protein